MKHVLVLVNGREVFIWYNVNSHLFPHREEVGIKLKRIEKMRRHMGSHFIKVTAALIHGSHNLLIMQT